MLSYCLKCRKNAKSKNPKVVRTKNGRIILYQNKGCVIVKNQNFLKNKKLEDEAFNIAKNPKYDGCQCGLASIVYNFFDKKASSGTFKNEIISNKELADDLHKPIITELN